MTEPQIRFDDGAIYERMMGVWSRLAGEHFLAWLRPGSGERWVDVGCGNGAFTELIVERCAPAAIDGIDPSESQLNYARIRSASRVVKFRQGDAMNLPYADSSFDIAVMALVIFFVPDPEKSVAEMVRVVRAGGTVAAYEWDMLGGGFSWEPLMVQLRELGQKTAHPPSVDASRIDVMRRLWTNAGMTDVETREISVRRTFVDFDDFLSTALMTPSIGPSIRSMQPDEIETLKNRLRKKVPPDANGGIACSARANAIKGRVRTAAV